MIKNRFSLFFLASFFLLGCVTDPVDPTSTTPPDVAMTVLVEGGEKKENIGPGHSDLVITAKAGDIVRVIARGYCKGGMKRLQVLYSGSEAQAGDSSNVVATSASTLLLGGLTLKPLAPNTTLIISTEAEGQSAPIVKTQRVIVQVPDTAPQLGMFQLAPTNIVRTTNTSKNFPVALSWYNNSETVTTSISKVDRNGAEQILFDNKGFEGKENTTVSETSVFKLTVTNRTGQSVSQYKAVYLFDEASLPLDDKIASAAGFLWDADQKIYYSKVDAWQRNLGYLALYDKAAPFALMFLDCEPVRFPYAGKNWKIEFWKGQYGICTGAEIGVYTGRLVANTGISLIDHTLNRFNLGDDTNCATNEDMLQMSFVLKRNNDVFFTRDSDDKNTFGVVEKHWWLTGFKKFTLSTRSELTMDVNIVFKDDTMAQAFAGGLKSLGYRDSDFTRNGASVRFVYGQPHSPQPNNIN